MGLFASEEQFPDAQLIRAIRLIPSGLWARARVLCNTLSVCYKYVQVVGTPPLEETSRSYSVT